MSTEANIKNKISNWGWKITKAGMNQGDFADLMGINVSTFNSYMTGRVIPKLSVIDDVETKLEEMGV